MRNVESQSARVLSCSHFRLPAGLIFEAYFRSGNPEIPAKQGAQRRTASSKVQTVFFEVIVAGAGEFVGRQKAGIRPYFSGAVKPHAPDLDTVGMET